MNLYNFGKLKSLSLLCGTFLATSVSALPISINFDIAQADYTPPSSVTDHFELTDQFKSLGLIFYDPTNTSLGAIVNGSSTSCVDSSQCSEAFHLYGNNGSGSNDVTPNISIDFFDPANGITPSFTDLFSIRISNVSSDNDTVLTAFDSLGNAIGTDGTSLSVGNGDILSLSGIGNIFSINIETLTTLTAYDDISFNPVVSAVPLPAAFWLMGSTLIGLLSLSKRSERAN